LAYAIHCHSIPYSLNHYLPIHFSLYPSLYPFESGLIYGITGTVPQKDRTRLMQKLLIATHNQGKLREYRQLLADLDLEITDLDAVGITYDVEETGTTFAENAILKARAYAEMSSLVTWSDDSGLEVDALDGRPGVYSARYGGPGLTPRDRYLLLLDELRPYPRPSWTARFRCVVALVLPNGELYTVDDKIEGVITDQPAGDYGFGYDPIFYLPEYQATLAEVSPEIKNQISHRGKASLAAKELLQTLLAQDNSQRNH
jgi:XTP/dITP diphosphohydrolase